MSKDLEVRHCRALLAVKDVGGGVGAAARGLGVAQSTLSETLLSLERLIGAPVLVRQTGRGAVLTRAAESLVPHARLMVSTSEAALAEASAVALRIGAAESISSFLLPRPLRAFRERWPHVNVHVAVGLCDDLRGRVGRAELDAALTIEGASSPDAACAMRDLSPSRLRFVVRPRHPLAREPVTRRDLEQRTLLLADHQGAFNLLLQAWLGGSGRLPRFESTGSVDGVKRGVLNSDAIGVLPEYAVADELSANSFAALDIADPPPAIALRLAVSQAPSEGSPLDCLISEIVSALPAN